MLTIEIKLSNVRKNCSLSDKITNLKYFSDWFWNIFQIFFIFLILFIYCQQNKWFLNIAWVNRKVYRLWVKIMHIYPEGENNKSPKKIAKCFILYDSLKKYWQTMRFILCKIKDWSTFYECLFKSIMTHTRKKFWKMTNDSSKKRSELIG